MNRPRKTRAESSDGRASARRGQEYEDFCEAGWPDQIISNEMTPAQVAQALGTPPANVSRWMAAYREDLEAAERMKNWQPGEEAKRALNDFAYFRSLVFLNVNDETGEEEPYKTTKFQLRWVMAMLVTITTGKRLMILSPPRHGKTDLLIHFCCWLIVKFPNIRILWVGGSEDLAKQAVSLVMTELKTNATLRRLFTPNGTFEPPHRSGLEWSALRFTVGTRTVRRKSPTMAGVGKGGTLLSRDADYIVADDIEDKKSVATPANRAATRQWWNSDLSSRKMKHTGMCVIGSRQHADDLYGSLLKRPAWTAIVEQAHNDAECTADPNDLDAHWDCCLFPEVRDYEYLMEIKADLMEATPWIWELTYQNNPDEEESTGFNREVMLECADRSLRIGDVRPGLRLIAGLDPAAAGFQAGVLWGVDVETGFRWLIDTDNTREQDWVTNFIRLATKWYIDYNLRDWVPEANAFQKAIKFDPRVKELQTRYGIRIHDHTTGANKHDPVYGVLGQVPLYADGKITLPYADEVSREKTNLFIAQHVNYDGQRRQFAARTGAIARGDLTMAAWFPEEQIRSFIRAASRVGSAAKATYGATEFPSEWAVG